MPEQNIQLTTRLIQQSSGGIEYHIAEVGAGTSDLFTGFFKGGVVFDESLFLQGMAMVKASIEAKRFNGPE